MDHSLEFLETAEGADVDMMIGETKEEKHVCTQEVTIARITMSLENIEKGQASLTASIAAIDAKLFKNGLATQVALTEKGLQTYKDTANKESAWMWRVLMALSLIIVGGAIKVVFFT